jgi:AraC-like DNA-binding protein
MSNTAKDYFRYLHVSPDDKLWGLYVTGVGTMNIGPDDLYPPAMHPDLYQFTWPQKRRLSEYQLLYIPVGAGEFESAGGGKHQVAPGSVIMTFPGDWHRYRPAPGVGWHEYWVGFLGEVADRLVQRNLISPARPVIRTLQSVTIQQACDSLIESVAEEYPGVQQSLAANVLEILGAALAAERVGPNGGRHAAVIKKAKQILASSHKKPPRMERLAARCHLSEAQFRRVFRQHVGVSPNQYYIQVRINRAKELLSGTVMSIKQIASALQFEDQFHFSKTFRKVTGVSPSQWRAGMAQEGERQ